MVGDGTNIKYEKFNKNANKTYHYTTNSYCTSSKKLMNDFCEIAIKSGYGITVSKKKKENYDIIYSIHILKSKNFKFNNKNLKRVKDFKDYVYCISVPNQLLLVKRNGKTCWCGNSPRQVSECYKKLDMTVNMETTQSSYWTYQRREIARVLKQGGKVINFGWNSCGIGKKLGFEITRIMLVSHGGGHNDNIVTVETKLPAFKTKEIF